MRVPADFPEQLAARIRRRVDGDRTVYFLDLRHRRFGDLGKLIIRTPGSAGWPAVGGAVEEESLARQVVREAYAPYLARELRVRQDPVVPSPTTRQAAADYLVALAAELGSTHNTVKNQGWSLNRHLVRAFGDIPLIQLRRDPLERFVQGLQVRARGGGPTHLVPAQYSTKKALMIALRGVWAHALPHEEYPFGDIALTAPRERPPTAAGGAVATPPLGAPAPGTRRAAPSTTRATTDGDAAWASTDAQEVTVEEIRRAYTREQMTRILTAALDRDLSPRAARPNQRACSTPNTAATIAISAGTGMRVSEIARWTWAHIAPDGHVARATDWQRGKTPASHRWFPVQDSIQVWLRFLYNQQVELNDGRAPRPQDRVIRGRPRQPAVDASRRTLQARVSRALEHAGLKWPGRATHIFRATHISWGIQSGLVDVQLLKSYIGHSNVFGGATDDYFELLPQHILPEHRRYIVLPSPADIAALLPAFRSGRDQLAVAPVRLYVPPGDPGALVRRTGT